MALIISFFIDLIFGEPYLIFHPVYYMGKFISFFDKKFKHSIFFGFLSFILIEAFFMGLLFLISKLNMIFSIIIYIFFISSSFAISSLYTHVKKCDTDDLSKLRYNVSMIVSRDTSKLSKKELYSAAVETLAENYVDSVLSPIFYYFLFGVYGIVFFRIANTMDAMIGYRNEKYEKYGKFAARTDDVLNFIPARLSYLFFVLFSPIKVSKSFFKFGKIKINGTKSMSCMAGLLKVNLKKEGVYNINPEYDLPDQKSLKKSLMYYIFICILTILIGVILLWLMKSFYMLNMEEMFLFPGLIFLYL
ncbi:adenosylcobinamide-phosphate synthase CbiB [Oceanotoga sp. DSM 15011]|jgi:adenosylcobinamide-phosphate synthase|uniref:Cobalamin biosynthesis protein CobD n=1 Tax=Oceanotoga teriensis TaxID=515440 RepID=A0AA45C983_9BACT|nr:MULTISPECIES: adenosylcobinamide-phosphate synthase CbiB [Oceanotoga]MDN5343676.1 adenosylcobinamide-phosphate synthase [Oceanotoga sp.]PWJ96672.1 adenosylcobinamide-phosphate synthase [Oceanotoga teriensis]UYP00156.1 adenosylcobinamide-phosphate synthase CbiB [Oceanotoga sp. DSM 15011]